jgi:hypothetical protein
MMGDLLMLMGALAGEYAGASGEVSLGVGVGANALFGSSKRGIALQPPSVEGQAGIDVSLGAGVRSVMP